MKASTVMNAIPAYSAEHWLEDLGTLLDTNLQSHSFSFGVEKPLNPNRNVITNNAAGAINAQMLELKASSLGVKRLAWIFGSDAVLLGLELKQGDDGIDPDPVILLASIKGKNGNYLEAHNAYFLEQFTAESLNDCFEQAIKKADEKALRMIRGVISYDSYGKQTDIIEIKRKALNGNTNPKSPSFFKAKSVYEANTKHLTGWEKSLFNIIRGYHTAQETGKSDAHGGNNEVKENAYMAIASVSGKTNRLSQIWYNAVEFASRLLREGFDSRPSINNQSLRRK